ncbi:MAG: glycosyltransferase family 4 protein [Planctomyces sp.]
MTRSSNQPASKPSDRIATDATLKSRPVVLHTRVVTGTGGGPEKTILNSPRFLAEYGIETACLFMHPPGDPGFETLKARAAKASAEIIGVEDRGPLDLNVVRQCIEICRRRNVTIWHGHDYKSNALGLLVRMFHPMHLVTTAHGWVRFTSKTPLYYRIDRFCMKRYEQTVCVSRDLYDTCLEFGVPKERVNLIDNAIVLEDYATNPPSLSDRARFGFGNGQLLIGAAGRLSEEKGFHHLIDAVGKLVREGLPLGLLIAGEGHLKEQLQQQIDDLELQNHVRLTGFLADPRELYRSIDLFVLSSLREGLPNVVLEAMASQRPVIATNCNGIPALISTEENGLVIRPDSCEALIDAIQRCSLSESLRDRLAKAGRQTIERNFCFRRRMQKIVAVYRKLSPQLAAEIPESAELPGRSIEPSTTSRTQSSDSSLKRAEPVSGRV